MDFGRNTAVREPTGLRDRRSRAGNGSRAPARGRRCSRLESAFDGDRHGRSRRLDGGWLCSISDGYARGLASQNGIKPQRSISLAESVMRRKQSPCPADPTGPVTIGLAR